MPGAWQSVCVGERWEIGKTRRDQKPGRTKFQHPKTSTWQVGGPREARDPYLGPWLYTPSGCPKGAYAADIVARGTRRGETVRGARVVGERVDQRLRLCFFIFMALVARGSPGRV